MNTLFKRRILIWGFIVLVLLNLSAFATILYFKFYSNQTVRCDKISEKRNDFHKEHRGYKHLIARKMDFNQDQMQSFDKHYQKHHLQVKQSFDEIDSLRHLIFDELAQQNPDSLKLRLLTDEYGIAHAKLKFRTVDFFLNLKKILNKGQYGKFNALMRKMENPSPHRTVRK